MLLDLPQEWLVPIGPADPSLSIRRKFLSCPYLGYYFKDAEIQPLQALDNDGGFITSCVWERFIMNDVLNDLYPDDGLYGADWVQNVETPADYSISDPRIRI